MNKAILSILIIFSTISLACAEGSGVDVGNGHIDVNYKTGPLTKNFILNNLYNVLSSSKIKKEYKKIFYYEIENSPWLESEIDIQVETSGPSYHNNDEFFVTFLTKESSLSAITIFPISLQEDHISNKAYLKQLLSVVISHFEFLGQERLKRKFQYELSEEIINSINEKYKPNDHYKDFFEND